MAPTNMVRPYPATPPPGFVAHEYHHIWQLNKPRAAVWAWLCNPDTFTDGQVRPYRVEFLANAEGPGDFREGVYNAHVGPFMSLSGILGEIRRQDYRDLQYFYGSYAISHALFRPTRLQFWLADRRDGGTELTLQVDAHVRKKAQRFWGRGMKLFWPRFGKWADSQA